MSKVRAKRRRATRFPINHFSPNCEIAAIIPEIGWRGHCPGILLRASNAAGFSISRERHRAEGDSPISEDNKTIVTRWFKEFWGNPWNPAVVNELAAADITLHYPMHEPRKGRVIVRQFMTEFRNAFPDLEFHGVGPLIAEGDYIVGRWAGGGTHTGPAFSDFRMGSLPAASGRKMQFAGTSVLRLKDGRIAEEFGQEDALTAMLQLGLIRIPEPEMQARPGGSLPSGWNNMPDRPTVTR